LNRHTPYQDPVEAHSFDEISLRYPDVPPAAPWLIVDSSSARAQEACWADIRSCADARTVAENIYEGRLVEPWCSSCHARLTAHEPGDCPKYKTPENGSPTSRSSDSEHLEFDHTDVLKTVPASVYVTAFTGIPVAVNGRILCPLHDDAPTPSFKCYGTTWTCFGGCGSGADIYVLASALTGIEAVGAGFIELRRWIAAALLGGGLRA
jgi:hypothetical protein